MKKKILFILFISGCFLTGSNAQSIAVKSNLAPDDATSTLNMGGWNSDCHVSGILHVPLNYNPWSPCNGRRLRHWGNTTGSQQYYELKQGWKKNIVKCFQNNSWGFFLKASDFRIVTEPVNEFFLAAPYATTHNFIKEFQIGFQLICKLDLTSNSNFYSDKGNYQVFAKLIIYVNNW